MIHFWWDRRYILSRIVGLLGCKWRICIYIYNGAGDGKFWCDGFRWLLGWRSDFVSNGESPTEETWHLFQTKNIPKRSSHSFVGIFNFHLFFLGLFFARFRLQIHSGCFFFGGSCYHQVLNPPSSDSSSLIMKVNCEDVWAKHLRRTYWKVTFQWNIHHFLKQEIHGKTHSFWWNLAKLSS